MTATGLTGSATEPGADLGADIEEVRVRLLRLRADLVRERSAAPSPAVARALEVAETYLYLGLGYLGHCDDLFPEEADQRPGDRR